MGVEIRYEVVKECICSIQQLSADYPAVVRPSVFSEGQGITEIEKLADLYESFYDSLERLSEETAKYLNNVITDFREMDEKMA